MSLAQFLMENDISELTKRLAERDGTVIILNNFVEKIRKRIPRHPLNLGVRLEDLDETIHLLDEHLGTLGPKG